MEWLAIGGIVTLYLLGKLAKAKSPRYGRGYRPTGTGGPPGPPPKNPSSVSKKED